MNRIGLMNTNVLKRSLVISSRLSNKQTNKEINIKLSKVNKNMNLAGTYYEMFDLDIGNVFHLKGSFSNILTVNGKLRYFSIDEYEKRLY